MNPLVSVITPTWQRHELLLNRCIPSVAAQTHRPLEHVIVSDGPDPELRELNWDELSGCRYYELPQHNPVARWGHYARLEGIRQAHGDLIVWLDDDNAFRPQHVERLAAALEADPGAGFAYSQILMHGHGSPYIVGASPPFCGGIDTSAIMHRRELLSLATWRDEGQGTNEWDLVERWIAAGARWAFDAEITADYYFADAWDDGRVVAYRER